MEKTVQEESCWKEMTFLENVDDDSGDTSGAVEFLDEVRKGRERRRAARLRKALTLSKTMTVKRRSSPPKRLLRLIGEDGSSTPRSDVPPAVGPKLKALEPGTPIADKGKAVVRPVDFQQPAKSKAEARNRKRAPSVELVREPFRVFNGLRFYFLPNDDVRVGRKIRIQRSRSHGAAWIKDWADPSITHVIVDNYLTHKDVLRHFKISEYPTTRMIVNEQWISDCIHFRFLVEADQVQYDVQGFPRAGKSRDVVSGFTHEDCEQPEPREKGLMSLPKPHEGAERSPHESQASASNARHVEHGEHRKSTDGPGDRGTQASVRSGLDEAIQATQLVASLPVPIDNSDHDPIIESTSPKDGEGDCANEDVLLEGSKQQSVDNPPWQTHFSCMQSSTSASTSTCGACPNVSTIEILHKMCDYYSLTRDHWRHTAYRRAINALKRHPTQVTTKEVAISIPGIGDRLADKIQEIVQTNTLRRLESTESSPNNEVLQMFCNIYGANYAQAQKWIAAGYRTLDDLRHKAELTHGQRIGLEYYKDFQTRIPRSEVEAHGAHVRSILHALDRAVTVTIGGSYRRGNVDSGDIDLLITKPGCPISELRRLVFDTALPELHRQGYIVANLTTPAATSSIWHGAAALLPDPSSTSQPRSAPSSSSSSSPLHPDPHRPLCRRIDMILVPHAEFGAALIYFTGNDIFNRSVRLVARKKGLRLNQRGLFRRNGRGITDGDNNDDDDDDRGGNGNGKSTRGRERGQSGGVGKGQQGEGQQGELVVVEEGMSERRIFEYLGIPWRRPEERVC